MPSLIPRLCLHVLPQDIHEVEIATDEFGFRPSSIETIPSLVGFRITDGFWVAGPGIPDLLAVEVLTGSVMLATRI